MEGKNTINKRNLIICFILYCLFLILVILFKTGSPQSILAMYDEDVIYIDNFLNGEIDPNKLWSYRFSQLPIKDRFMAQFEYINNGNVAFDFFANILIFLPFGVCVYVMSTKHQIINSLIYGFIMSFALELTQLLSKIGGLEFVDIFSNTIGSLFGGLFAALLHKKLKENTYNKAVNISSIVASIVELPLSIYMIAMVIINWNVYLFRLGL